MSRLYDAKHNRNMRKNRVRSKIHGSKDVPRLSVNISLNNVSAQLIDDDSSTTIAYVSSQALKLNGTLSEKSSRIGSEIAKQARVKKVKRVVFDRGEKLYHGRIKSLADAAREEGLEF